MNRIIQSDGTKLPAILKIDQYKVAFQDGKGLQNLILIKKSLLKKRIHYWLAFIKHMVFFIIKKYYNFQVLSGNNLKALFIKKINNYEKDTSIALSILFI